MPRVLTRSGIGASAAVIAATVLCGSVARSGQESTPVHALFLRYTSGDRDLDQPLRTLPPKDVFEQLSAVVRDRLRRGATARERRELAAFALECARAVLYSGGLSRPAREKGDGREPPTYFQSLVDFGRRQVEADRTDDTFYKHWFHAAIAVLEGGLLGELVDDYARTALKVFPGNPRFLLALGVAAEINTTPHVGGADGLSDRRLRDAATLFSAAMAHSDVRGEAELRLGFLQTRAGHHREALDLLRNAERNVHEAGLEYLVHLFRGRALDASDRPNEAIDAFVRALEIAPGAQSAQLALAAVHFEGTDRDRASELTGDLLRRPQVAHDPWWTYWIGDARFWPDIIQTLRQGLR